jgi:hypothetical protein
VWRLPWPCVRHLSPAEAWRQVVLVQWANVFQLGSSRFFPSGWQQRSPLLVALSLAHEDLVAGDVRVLHAETPTLQQAQTGTLEAAGHAPVDALQRAEQRSALWSRQHNR